MPHRTLIIGVGSIGERHLRCFKATGRTEVGLVELNPALRQTIAQRYEVKHAYADLEAALGEGFDLGLVATPAQLHIPIAMRLVERGMHTLIEKPLATSLDGIDRLKALRDKQKVAVGVAYVYRAMAPLRAMRQAILEGRFGKPVQAVVVCGQNFPHYRPAYREIYYKDRKTGGGAIQDALTHMINAVEWIVGPIDRLVADAAHQLLEGVSVEDTAHLLARHGQVMGSYCLNQYQAFNETSITIVCERGTARLEAAHNRWRWVTKPEEPWHDEEFGKPERDTAFTAQANAFLDAVEGKAPPACTLEEGEQTLRVNMAALAAADKGSLAPLR